MYRIEQTDCFEWLRHCPGHSVHAVCTDPPYGILEFTEKELAKLRAGRGGVWRLPSRSVAAFYGSQRGAETTPARLLSRLGHAPPARSRSGRARLRGRPSDS